MCSQVLVMDKAECRIAEMGTLWLVLVPDCKSFLNAFVSPAGGVFRFGFSGRAQ